jgi:uncharacterized protein
MGEFVYERTQGREGNPQLKDPNPPRSAHNSPPRRGVELMPTVVLVEDEDELTKLAEKGDLKAQLALGRMYWERSQKEKSRDLRNEQKTTAIKWCRQPARAGILGAQYLLACCLEYGKEKTGEWITWLRKSADGGDADVQYKLASAYQSGEKGLLPKSDALRFKYLLLAAKQDHVEAQCDTAMCYGSGWGTEKCEAQKLYWTRRAAGNGNASSQHSLGFAYLHGHGYCGLVIDRAVAVKWFQDASNQDYDPATIELARCFIHGWGIWPTPKKAVRLLEGVIAQPPNKWTGSRSGPWYEAKLELAICLVEGIGIDKDPAKSKALLAELIKPDGKRSSNHDEGGSHEAQYYLGTCYETGRLGEQDYGKAFALYEKAQKGHGLFHISSTHYKAKFRMGLCYFNGWGVEENKKTAVAYFDLTYVHVPEAAYYRGLCYEKGLGAAKSEALARLSYETVICENAIQGLPPAKIKEAREGLKRLDECVIL